MMSGGIDIFSLFSSMLSAVSLTATSFKDNEPVTILGKNSHNYSFKSFITLNF